MSGDGDSESGGRSNNRQFDKDWLYDEMGFDEDLLSMRKRYIDFDDEDEKRVMRMTPVFERIQDDLADEFYDKLLVYNETADVISDTDVTVDQLKETQKRYLLSLGNYGYEPGDGAGYGESYAKSRLAIGHMHVLIGLTPPWYIGAYSVYHDMILEELFEDTYDKMRRHHDIDEEAFDELDELREDILAYLRLVNFDMQLAIDTYLHRMVAQSSGNARHETTDKGSSIVERISGMFG
ncbi:MAG: protoglobin domain-containing protein [Halobacteria archaeon]|nr:protoglobin domain-containing protein [Halobacteria archaeon]